MELHSEILLKNLNQARKETQSTFNNLMKGKREEIRFLIKQRWLFGRKPDGSLIGQYSSPKYAQEKHKLNPKAGLFNVDLIDHQDLVDAIELVIREKNIAIISKDEKFKKIAKKYGLENFNLSDEEQEEIINEVSALTLDNLYNKYVL